MSALGRDVRHGLGIARVELRRSLRKSFGTRKRQLTALGFVALFSPLLVFWFGIARDAGREAAARGTLPLDLLGVQVSLLVVVFVVVGALRVVQQGRPEGDALLLTATTPRAVLVGVSLHATIRLVGFVSLPTLLFAGGFALGAGAPTVALLAVLAVIPLFSAVSMLGTVVGKLAVLGLLQSRRLRTVSRAFGLALLLALMALSYAAMAPVMGAAAPLALLATVTRPAALYLAFVFLGTPFGPGLSAGSVAVGALVVAAVPALFAVANRLAPRLWFADATPTELLQRDTSAPTGGEPSPGATTRRGGDPFPPRVGPRPLSLALGLWVRWLRIPVRFSPLFPLVIVLATALFGTVDDPDSIPLVAGGVLVFAGVYLSGAVFGLNPLGEAGAMRAVESLSATAPRTLVLGHVLAGLLAGTPTAIAGAVLLAVTLGTTVPTGVALAALAAVLSVASAGVAVGIGTVLPSRDAQRTYRGYEVATPSQWALVGYVVAAMLLVGVAAAGAAVAFILVGEGSLLAVVALAAAAAVLLAVGYAGFRTSVGRFAAPPVPEAGSVSRDQIVE